MARESFRIESDLAYINDKKDYHRFDAYIPNGSGPHAVVIHVHGGGWVRGSRKSWAYGATPLCTKLAKTGLLCYSVSYRLGTPHPAAIQDVAAAVTHILTDAVGRHGGDPERVFLSGHSAGGHLITLLFAQPGYLAAAYRERGLDLPPAPDRLFRGLIGISGVYSIDNPFGDPSSIMHKWFHFRYVPPIFGRQPSDWRSASPVYHLQQALFAVYANSPSTSPAASSSSSPSSSPPTQSPATSPPTSPRSPALSTSDAASFDAAMAAPADDIVWADDETNSPGGAVEDADESDGLVESQSSNEPGGDQPSAPRTRFLIVNAEVDLGLDHCGRQLYALTSSLGYASSYMVVQCTNHVTVCIKDHAVQRVAQWIAEQCHHLQA